jgi:hypothetical protein
LKHCAISGDRHQLITKLKGEELSLEEGLRAERFPLPTKLELNSGLQAERIPHPLKAP